MKLSCCVPTLNRSKSLITTLKSLINQSIEPQDYEILVIDNGSKDDTRIQVQNFLEKNPEHSIRYIFEPEPGLLSGRHRGALESRGDILVFFDDDIEATPRVLNAFLQAFDDPETQLAGGPSLPKYETDPPKWLQNFWRATPFGGRMCTFLSLLDLGDKLIEIHPNFVFGLNLAIRRTALFELGGFHPDTISSSLMEFCGDGETGLTAKAHARGFKAIFTPSAKLYHLVPGARMTPEYFERRAFYQGVCDSYTQIRQRGHVPRLPVSLLKRRLSLARGFFETLALPKSYVSTIREDHLQTVAIKQRVQKAYIYGFKFHQEAVRCSPELLNWVIKPNYWNYRIPRGVFSSLERKSRGSGYEI